jgi:archaellum component FlaF (FlaF/FlaG flagellin family)
MGFSTAYGNIILILVSITSIVLLWNTYSSDIVETTETSDEQFDRLKERLDTRIRINEVVTSTADNDVRFFVENVGSTNINPNCTDFYIDRQLIKASDMDELILLNTTVDPGLWNPTETLKMVYTYPTDRTVEHEGRVVSCNGVVDSLIFRFVGA